MHKRVVFQHRVLPYLLVAPQILVTLVFFIWPAGQALLQSVLLEDAFGLSTRFVWFENFERLFRDPTYLHSLRVTMVFSVAPHRRPHPYRGSLSQKNRAPSTPAETSAKPDHRGCLPMSSISYSSPLYSGER